MALSVGDKLGPYEVLAPIGKGGMGEVWKARDTKLGRDVALKILPAAFASDLDRMARFEREARVLASLDHPNIAAIYGIEESDGIRALVLALVDGPTLAERIAGGPIRLDESIQIARQIADAVEYAHERGVIHRDLKPANIKITPGGMVKVLDFGLAKALDDEPVPGSGTNSPTLTMGATRAGVLLGTAAYMSPEQAKGKQADRRSDIWSFGAVLYEMTTGKPPFSGETVGETLASVIKDQPKLDAVPMDVRGLIGRCLNKDPRQRLQAIGEARIALENPVPGSSITTVAEQRSRALPLIIAVVLALTFGLGLIALEFVHYRERPPELSGLAKYQISLPENTTFANHVSISPDGKLIAFAATGRDHRTLLWLRPINALEAHPVPETDNAGYFFWSPDSHYVAYWADGKVKKVAVTGGAPEIICDAPVSLSGTWNDKGLILLGSNTRSISRVPSAGGSTVPVIALRPEEAYQAWPFFLPDGKHFLYMSVNRENAGAIEIAELDAKGGAKNQKRLMASTSGGIYVPSSMPNQGHILFRQNGRLLAQTFDLNRLEIVGEPILVADQIGTLFTRAFFGASQSTIVYRSGKTGGEMQLRWVNREGKPSDDFTPAGSLDEELSLSPEGTRAAVSRIDNNNTDRPDIWIIDLMRRTNTRLTFGPRAGKHNVAWSPDGKMIAYASGQNIAVRAASGAGEEKLLVASREAKRPWDWSRDGHLLLYSAPNQENKINLWLLSMDDEKRSKLYLHSEFNQFEGQFSPDGRYVAYVSDESGRAEVYVQQFPAAGGKWQISTQGGLQPRWRADGRELYYVSLVNEITAVEVDSSKDFRAGVPMPLFTTSGDVGSAVAFQYSPSRDGKRFLLLSSSGKQSAESPFTVLVNWTSGR